MKAASCAVTLKIAQLRITPFVAKVDASRTVAINGAVASCASWDQPLYPSRQGESNPRRKSQERTSVGHFVGTRAFNSSTQFSTTTIPVGVDVGSPPAALIIKNVWPSRETS